MQECTPTDTMCAINIHPESFAVCQIIDIIIDAAAFPKDTTGCVLNLVMRTHLSGPGSLG